MQNDMHKLSVEGYVYTLSGENYSYSIMENAMKAVILQYLKTQQVISSLRKRGGEGRKTPNSGFKQKNCSKYLCFLERKSENVVKKL